MHDPTHEGAVPLGELERRMRPGVYSRDGFLGAGERLSDVLAADATTVGTLGLTCEAIAERLGNLIRAAVGDPGRRTTTPDGLEIEVMLFKGFQICPWARDPHAGQCTDGGGVEFGSVDWKITNARIHRTLSGPGLLVHLIRDHRFFEGKGSPRRVDPVALAELLELVRRS